MSIADVSASSVDCIHSGPHAADMPATTSHVATVKKVYMTAHYCYTSCCYEVATYIHKLNAQCVDKGICCVYKAILGKCVVWTTWIHIVLALKA